MIKGRLNNAFQIEGEREAASMLAKFPDVVRWSVCRTGGHSTYVLKEFPFGSSYKADFVVATSYSWAWDVHFIELEPPQDIVITRDGLPSKRFNKAISQIEDWKEFVLQNPGFIRKELSK